jgi:hypothetical protein
MFKIARRNNASIRYTSVEEIREATSSAVFRTFSIFIMKEPEY